jgi:hypothetical protein
VCAEVTLKAKDDGDGTTGCCGGNNPDSMIVAFSAW